MLPRKIQDIIDKLPNSMQELIGFVITFFEKRLTDYEQELASKNQRIKELENQLSKNSQNSSKPPSTDQPYNKPSPKSRRIKTGKRPGGQKGHKGSTLKMVETPDEYVHHKVERCTSCGCNLADIRVKKISRRQVYDLPPLNIRVVEHQSEIKTCSCGCQNSNFPAAVSHYVQYGPRIKGLMVYLQNYQLLPYSRTSELIEDLFVHKISCGTLYNTQKQAYNRLENFEIDLKTVLTLAAVAGFDETGFRVLTSCWWLHSCSTDSHAYYEVHKKRGNEAMDEIGILPNFNGIAIHDFWKSYLKYTCTHGLCNAHLIRELTFIHERLTEEDETWAKELIELLLEIKNTKEEAIRAGKTFLTNDVLKRFDEEYDKIIKRGLDANPFSPPVYAKGQKKKPGRHKKTKQRNLLERLRDYKTDIIRFCKNFSVPFDNNFSERDIRMMKLKQKISGCFRSKQGALYFARIRSFIISARKQKRNILQDLTDIFETNSAWRNIVNFSYAE